jgi:hypothetical protein
MKTARCCSLVAAWVVLSCLCHAQITFTDVTATAGTGLGDGTARPVAWGDSNNDGLPDLFLPTSGSSTNKLYINNGNGTFSEIAAIVGLNDIANTNTCSWVDFDNDGDLDLLTTTAGAGPTRLWRNNRETGIDTTFTSIESLVGINMTSAQMSTWADYNNDGFVDFYSPVSNSTSSDALYRSNAAQSFTNVADSAGVNHPVSGVLEQGMHWGDYDKDGDPDLYIANLAAAGPSYFHRNNGNGTFTEIAPTLGFQGGGRGGQWIDYNNDGLWDLSMTAYAGASVPVPIRVFRNNGNGTFTDLAASIGISDGLISWSLTWADFDNNGFEDVFVTASGQSTTCQLYRNNGDGTFTNVTSAAGLAGLVQLCAAWADYDNDGFMDLYTSGAASAGNHLFKSSRDTTTHWLKVNLAGTVSNRSGVGAQIWVKSGSLRMMREINTGIGWRSQNMMTAHFGLSTNTAADSVVVRWPSGNVSVMTNVQTDRTVTITEQALVPRPIINVSPDTLTLILANMYRDSIRVANTGTATLRVDTIYAVGDTLNWFLRVNPRSFTLAPGAFRHVRVYLDIPVHAAPIFQFIDTLFVRSNDPIDSVVNVVLRGDYPRGVGTEEKPFTFGLEQNYPNPFNPSTKISFKLKVSSFTKLKVFDLLGREVATLVNEVKQPGTYEVTWDAGERSSGVYFYRLAAGSSVETRKLMLLK